MHLFRYQRCNPSRPPRPRWHGDGATHRKARQARDEAKSGGQTVSLGRTSFLRLFRVGKCADLPHQTQLILDGPRLGDLTCLYAVYRDAREFHFFASRGDARVLPLVSGAAPPASYHLIPLGYEVLNGAYHIWEALTEIGCLLPGGLDLFGCKELLCCVEGTGMVPELFLFPAH